MKDWNIHGGHEEVVIVKGRESSERQDKPTQTHEKTHTQEHHTATHKKPHNSARSRSRRRRLCLLLLLRLTRRQALMDERQDTTACDRRLHEDIELFVASDGELEVAGRYAFYAEIFGCVAYR